MRILVVVAHGRAKSLTQQAADAFISSARDQGHNVEIADLVAERFDPVLAEADEPDWNDPDKTYSDAVRREMSRIERNEATVMVFPVWRWSIPAILKGWIDRVWNYGWAYGPRAYPHKRVLMIAIAGNGKDAYEKRDYDKAMRTQLATGILDYCGVEDGRLEMLFGAIEGGEGPTEIIRSASALGAVF